MIVELYRFTIGTDSFRLTTAPDAVEHDGQSYAPSYIQRDAVRSGDEIARSRINIRLPRDAAIAQRFVGGAPATICEVDIFQRVGETTMLVWTGRLAAVAWAGSEAVAECEPMFTSLKRSGLRARYQKNCRHALYDGGCTLNRNDFRVQAVLTARTSLTLTADEFGAHANGHFTAGYVEHPAAGRRAIIGHAGNTITMGAPMVETSVGDTVFAFAGCDHTFAACRDKFSNEVNFGGFPFIPLRNPFGQNPVF